MNRAITASTLIATLTQVAGAQQRQWYEEFGTYPLGTVLDNVGGWTGWDNNSAYAGLVTSTAFSWGHVVQVDPALGGPVHEFAGITGGSWQIYLYQYLPAAFANDQAYVVINNVYTVPGLKEWAVRILCDSASAKVLDDLRPEANSINIVYDQWNEIRFDINLNADTIRTHYNGVLLSEGQYAIGGGPTEMANINLWTDRFATTPVYYDEIYLWYNCYPDCDFSTGIGVLDIFDFLCFQDAFVNGDPYACDCDTGGYGVCDIFDFLCFQNAFVSGCP